ncbi:MAG: RagB/SusD family nutrient uptake outer membrane protein [Bacteroidales bacterium]|nr:RagB/SusD family nutrient uptake outer membrane protein [Bacteroidales bacterium]
MKTRLFVTATLLLGALSCGKMLDDISPKGAITKDKLTPSDISLLNNGVMHQFEAIVSNLWFEGDYIAENYASGPGFSFSDTHAETQSASSATALTRWNYCFGKLQYANLLIDAAKDNASRDAQEALGVGYFFRAYIYYNLVTRYGGVPRIEKPTTLDPSVPRQSEADIWQFILDDLNRADACLLAAQTGFKSFAYVSPEAVALLRARVYLWQGNYSGAVSEASSVIGSPAGFTLGGTSADWAGMFVSGTSSKELVFAPINIRSTDYIRLFEKVNDTDGSFNYSPTQALYNGLYADDALRTGDIRKAATFGEDATRVIKFPNGQAGQFIANPLPSESPLPVFRLADAYFIKAEAEWLDGSVDDALSTLKTLMEKRYAAVSLPATMTDAAFETLFMDELQREFYGEGRRWFDVKRLAIRHHGYVSATDYSSKDFPAWIKTVYPGNDSYTIDGWNDRHQLMYWPIPQTERDKSYGALTQNPGYEQ